MDTDFHCFFGFGMNESQAEYELTQMEKAAEQQDIFDSIQSKVEVVVNMRIIHEAYMEHEQLFVNKDKVKEASAFSPTANDHDVGIFSANIIDIF